MQNAKTKKKSSTMQKVGRFVVAFTIFALYTSFSPSDGTIEDPSLAQNSKAKIEMKA